MLSYALAIAVATSSLVLFSTAFLMSDIHRKDDFLWSGVGLLYALVLWYCAHNITGAVLLGQAAATVLLVSYSWQTINLRKAIANPAKVVETNKFSVLQSINGLLKRNQPQVQPAVTAVTTANPPKVTEQEIAIPDATPESDRTVAQTQEISSTNDVNTLGADRKPIKNSQAETKNINNSEAAVKDTLTTKDKPVNQPAKETQPQNLQPSKPSELADTEQTKPTKPAIVIQDKRIDRSPNTVENTETNSALPSEPEVKTEGSLDNRQQANIPNIDIQSESETISPETSESAKAKASPLDSLETVEVAEVLEANPEDTSFNRESDRSNIIEVTTTEINITSEVKKIDRNQKENSEFKEE
ncbi:MAG TPA: Ycf66 family protein [Coleofasciculaceae cyanobacterium]|jgi:hypothetical protein